MHKNKKRIIISLGKLAGIGPDVVIILTQKT